LDQPRSSQRYRAKAISKEEQNLTTRLHALVRKYPRYGYRFITAKLRQEGWRVNFKQVYRLWRREGFQVPRHAKYVTFQLAEVAVTRRLFASILDRIARLAIPPPLAAGHGV